MVNTTMMIRVIASVITDGRAAYVAAFGPVRLAQKQANIQEALTTLLVATICGVAAFMLPDLTPPFLVSGIIILIWGLSGLRHCRGYYGEYAAAWQNTKHISGIMSPRLQRFASGLYASSAG